MARLRPAASGLAVAAALALSAVALAAAAGGLEFNGPTIKNPTVPPLFTLHDQDGHRVALAKQRGRVVLLTFLYTHCPDVCPLVAGNLNRALRALGPGRRDVRVLAISVDPTGDTRASVQRFIRHHQLLPEFRYLTGPPATLRRLWAAYGVSSLKEAGGDRVDHTLYTLLLDKSLRGRVIYDSTATVSDIEHDVRLLLGSAK
jgi:protein SCO1/2